MIMLIKESYNSEEHKKVDKVLPSSEVDGYDIGLSNYSVEEFSQYYDENYEAPEDFISISFNFKTNVFDVLYLDRVFNFNLLSDAVKFIKTKGFII